MPARHPVDPKKANKDLELPALITGLCQFYGVSVTLARSSSPLLIELSSRSIAPQGRRRAQHPSSLGMAGSGQ